MSAQPSHAFAKAADILAADADVAVAAIGSGMRSWLRGNCAGDLGEALGIDGDVRREWREALLDERDAELRAMAAQFFAGQAQAAQADAINSALNRYAATGWLRERALDACPVRHAGTMTANCWAVLRIRDSVPSARHIRRILAMA